MFTWSFDMYTSAVKFFPCESDSFLVDSTLADSLYRTDHLFALFWWESDSRLAESCFSEPLHRCGHAAIDSRSLIFSWLWTRADSFAFRAWLRKKTSYVHTCELFHESGNHLKWWMALGRDIVPGMSHGFYLIQWNTVIRSGGPSQR